MTLPMLPHSAAHAQALTLVVPSRRRRPHRHRHRPTQIELINRLSATGLTSIEATAFVSPKWVPQMADAADVLAAIERRPSITYSALTPNMKGFNEAVAAGAQVFGEEGNGLQSSARTLTSRGNIMPSLTSRATPMQPNNVCTLGGSGVRGGVGGVFAEEHEL